MMGVIITETSTSGTRLILMTFRRAIVTPSANAYATFFMKPPAGSRRRLVLSGLRLVSSDR